MITYEGTLYKAWSGEIVIDECGSDKEHREGGGSTIWLNGGERQHRRHHIADLFEPFLGKKGRFQITITLKDEEPAE